MSRRGPEVAALVDLSRTERIRAVALGIACHGAFIDAGLGLRTGWLGWSSIVRGREPEVPRFTPGGLFHFTRQPIYAAFTSTLWTGPCSPRIVCSSQVPGRFIA